ncbi:MAG TPA: PAS domain-containing sensor histidine kinase, partial [Thermoanaerobaculia bacterium]|nr:PAS domain-containing sensor histidine kinase [Thermoanaerobaculia bacterium]
MHPDTQRRVSTYSLALLAAAGAVALRWLLAPWLGDQRPLVTAVGAVAATAWLGGLRPGLLAAALSVLGCGALFLPRGGLAAPGALLDPAADLASCALVLGLGAGLWAARRRESGERLAAAAADGRVRQAERAAQAAEERLTAVLASIDDHLVCYDRQWCYTYVNEGAACLLGKSRHELLGRCIWDLFPDAVGNQYYREVHEAAREQKVIRSEHFYPPFGMWFENYIYPTAGGVTVFASDVTERKRAEQALREADQRKDDFLAMLAHELRNPLAPISNALHLLRLGDDEAERGRVLAMCERQVRHLVRLVDDLLEVSRITRGKIDLRKERIELADVVHSAVETSRPLIEAAAHRLDLDLAAEAVALEADPVRLAQVIANLLNNAARYTDAGGHIRLAGHREGGDVVLSVRDDGMGIPADLLPRVFDLF